MASPSSSGRRRSRLLTQIDQTAVLDYYSKMFNPDELTCPRKGENNHSAFGGGGAYEDVKASVLRIFKRWNCIRNDSQKSKSKTASPVVGVDAIQLTVNPLFDAPADEPGVEPGGTTTFESLPADALLLILEHLKTIDILKLMHVNTTIHASVREQFRYIKPDPEHGSASMRARAWRTTFAMLIQNVYSMCTQLNDIDTFHVYIGNSEEIDLYNYYEGKSPAKTVRVRQSYVDRLCPGGPRGCTKITFTFTKMDHVRTCNIQFRDFTHYTHENGDYAFVEKQRQLPDITVIATDTNGNLQFDYNTTDFRRFMQEINVPQSHALTTGENVSIKYPIGFARSVLRSVLRNAVYEPARILFCARLVQARRLLVEMYAQKLKATRYTDPPRPTRGPTTFTARVDSTAPVSTNTRPQYFTVHEIKSMRNAGLTHSDINKAFRDGRLTAAHRTAVANRNAMNAFAGMRVGGSSTSRSTWTSTGGRKAACADGIERALWKNTATGELRVKRFVRRRNNGKALAAYFPA